MKKACFKKWGWIYLPIAWPAWAAAAFTLLFSVQVFVAVDRHSHSASDTLYGIFPYVVPAFGILGWVASRTTKKNS
jgi:hypothetical protein